MKREERQKTILDTTMRLIAEYGFFDFSMKDVAERVQISGVVVYRDFESRENLMIEAYKSVREEFFHFSEALMVPAESNQSIKTGILKYIGYSYMKFLVRLGHRLIFLRAFLDTPAFQAEKAAFKAEFLSMLKEKLDLEKMNENRMWHVLFAEAAAIAQDIIRGELPDSDETYTLACHMFYCQIKEDIE